MSAAEQLGLFAPPVAREVAEGWCSGLPERGGLDGFIHIVRGEGDPERPPRGAMGPTDWKRINDLTPAQWAQRIVDHLSDGEPRTFNRIAVELMGITADVAYCENPDKGLWHAVEMGKLLWSTGSPVLFTVAQGGE